MTAVPDAGYEFVDWSDGVLTASRTDQNVTADINVTASFIEVPTAVLLSRFDAETTNDGIALRWQFGDASEVESVNLERSSFVTGPWKLIEAPVTTENEVATLIDRSVEAEHMYFYRLAVKTTTGDRLTFAPVEGTAGALVKEFALARISPNPMVNMARIDYAVAREGRVKIGIVDIQGRTVATLVDGVQRPGRYTATWSGAVARGMAPAGVYFVRYEAGGKSMVKRLLLTR